MAPFAGSSDQEVSNVKLFTWFSLDAHYRVFRSAQATSAMHHPEYRKLAGNLKHDNAGSYQMGRKAPSRRCGGLYADPCGQGYAERSTRPASIAAARRCMVVFCGMPGRGVLMPGRVSALNPLPSVNPPRVPATQLPLPGWLF